MMNMKRFIDSLEIENVPLDMDYSKREHKNMFMDMHNCTTYSSLAEAGLSSKKHSLIGNVDLTVGDWIIDYKTGKANSLDDVKNKMLTSKKQDYFEFQPMIYLSMLKEKYPPPCKFSLFYAADNDVRSVTEEGFRIEDNIRDAILIPISMKEYLSEQDSCVKNEFNTNSYKKITDSWSSFVNRAFDAGTDACDTWKKDMELISSLLGIVGMSDAKTNVTSVARVLNRLSEILSEGMHVCGRMVIIPIDTIEKFLLQVDEYRELASLQVYTDFPAKPEINCDKCSFYKACTRDVVDMEEDAGGDDEND
jgi:hypothetical protein